LIKRSFEDNIAEYFQATVLAARPGTRCPPAAI
jgi:hypothetical protein